MPAAVRLVLVREGEQAVQLGPLEVGFLEEVFHGNDQL
jgi:hypothetical protein